MWLLNSYRFAALIQYLFNGFPASLATGSGSALVADYAGVLRAATSPTAAIEGGRLTDGVWYDTLVDGTPLQPSAMVKTVSGGSVKRYIDYPNRANTATYTVGAKVTALATDGIRRWYEATAITTGISAGSPPSMPTSGTVVDDGVTWTYGGYATLNHKRVLGEPARTNLLTYSEQFDNAAWTKTNTTITPNATTAPDGTLTADSFIHIASNGFIRQSVVNSSAVTATCAAYVKQNSGGGFFRVIVADDATAANAFGGWFNLATGAWATTSSPGSGTLASFGVDALSNGFYRIWLTGATIGTTYTNYLYITDSDNSSTRSTTKSAFIWGAQLEAGAFPTSYRKTGAATDTRPATVNSIASAGVLRAQDWGFRLQINPLAAGQTAYALSSYTDANNETSVLYTPTAITFRKRIAGVDTDCTVSYSHAKDVPVQVDVRQDAVLGMGIRTRQLSGADWSAWSDWTEVSTAAGKADCIIAATVEKGSRNGAGQLACRFNLFETIFSADIKTKLEALA